MTHTLGRLLGIDRATSIDRIDVALAAPWAVEGEFWVFLLVVAALAGSLLFYLQWQRKGPAGPRAALGIFRGLLLGLRRLQRLCRLRRLRLWRRLWGCLGLLLLCRGSARERRCCQSDDHGGGQRPAPRPDRCGPIIHCNCSLVISVRGE